MCVTGLLEQGAENVGEQPKEEDLEQDKVDQSSFQEGLANGLGGLAGAMDAILMGFGIQFCCECRHSCVKSMENIENVKREELRDVCIFY